jgi:hypothetical protein
MSFSNGFVSYIQNSLQIYKPKLTILCNNFEKFIKNPHKVIKFNDNPAFILSNEGLEFPNSKNILDKLNDLINFDDNDCCYIINDIKIYQYIVPLEYDNDTAELFIQSLKKLGLQEDEFTIHPKLLQPGYFIMCKHVKYYILKNNIFKVNKCIDADVIYIALPNNN